MINIPDLNIEQYWDKIATVVLAAWGAWISTLSYLKDNAKIKVYITKGQVGDINFEYSQDVYIFGVMNVGRRPVVINKVTLQTDIKDDLLALPDAYIKYTLPVKLNENEETSVIIDAKRIIDLCKREKCNVEYLVFTDVTNKRYKCKLKNNSWKELKQNSAKSILKKIIDKIWFH